MFYEPPSSENTAVWHDCVDLRNPGAAANRSKAKRGDAMLRSWTSPARRELDELVELSHYCDFNQLATFVDGTRPH